VVCENLLNRAFHAEQANLAKSNFGGDPQSMIREKWLKTSEGSLLCYNELVPFDWYPDVFIILCGSPPNKNIGNNVWYYVEKCKKKQRVFAPKFIVAGGIHAA
jgi:hypothetical protein